jgi:hypothetical protein
MGINSTEVAYGFGQLGSGFSDVASVVTPPAGKVIVAIQFLEDTVLSTLVAATDTPDTAYFSHTAAGGNNGGGSRAIRCRDNFSKGSHYIWKMG